MTDRRVLLRRFRRASILAILVVFGGGALYFRYAFAPAGYPLSLLESDARVRVENTADALTFLPAASDPDAAGLIFYAGCPVPAESYAPFGRAIAERGHPVFIVHIPYLCATQEAQQQELFDRTRRLMASSPRPWVLAGHSRGGALASRFTAEQPDRVAGLLLEGTTHPREVSLASLRIPVVKVIATHDGVAPADRSLALAGLLPPATRWITIQGGNHAQFGYYHFQLWDGWASIPREEQQRQLVAAAVELLEYCSRTAS